MIHSLEHLSSVSTKMRAGELSPVTLARECLARIKGLNSRLNAFITILEDDALARAEKAAEEIKAGKWRGPLHGIPVAIKDFYDTAGIKTTGGFEPLKDRVPDQDAPVVARLKRAGAIVVGKTNMDALGMETTGLTSAFGPVHNPWDPEYVSGGSSAGSATAVATGMCYATVDTDAVGSTRLPAACCGVVGLKASEGLIDGGGILTGTQDPGEMIHLLSHVGITAQTVEDAAVMLTALADQPAPDYLAETRRPDRALRIGVANNVTATQEVRTMFETAASKLRELGYPVAQVAIPMDRPKFDSSTIVEDRARIDELLFGDIDVLITPTLTREVPRITEARSAGQQAVSPTNTFFVNYFSLMALSVPGGFTSNKMPQGLQFVARKGHDAECLKVAFDYQQAIDWMSAVSA